MTWEGQAGPDRTWEGARQQGMAGAHSIAAHPKISVQHPDGLLWGQDRLFLVSVVYLQDDGMDAQYT